MRVALIGTGRMGAPMARNILKQNHALAAYDVSAKALATLEDSSARICTSAVDAVRDAEIVLTSLPGPKQVEFVMAEIEPAVTGDAIVADTSTTSPEQSRAMAARFAAKNVAYLDAPISGGVEGAVKGTLTVMVGGDVAAFRRAVPVLSAIGTDVHHIGPSGAGNGVKLIIQMIFMTYVGTFMEGLALADRLGVPMETALRVIGTSSAGRPDLSKRFEKILKDDLSPRSEVALGLKDLMLARELCETEKLDAIITRASAEAFRLAAEAGYADKDLIALRNAARERKV